MVLFSLFGFGTRSTVGMATPSFSTSRAPSAAEVEDRLRGALWGFFAGDALSAPTHWYYGGQRQVVSEYGQPISDYTKPNMNLVGSILNKSNLNGGGRSSYVGSGSSVKTIIGDVINHGKKELWSPDKSIHYHATLQKGENTLEVQIARVLMKNIVKNGGMFNLEDFRNAYIEFMMTPGSHNDTYASTCHRMFFSNLVHGKLTPDQCPDNDQHNVDTMDGLVLPTIAAMANADPVVASACARATRKSQVLEQVSSLWGSVVRAAILQSDDNSFNEMLSQFSVQTIRRQPDPSVHDSQTMSACYLSQSLPGLVDIVAKYVKVPSSNRVWDGLLANANVGGENVHRGSIMGAILGARTGASRLPSHLIDGLYHRQLLHQEIDDFVAAILPSLVNQESTNKFASDTKE